MYLALILLFFFFFFFFFCLFALGLRNLGLRKPRGNLAILSQENRIHGRAALCIVSPELPRNEVVT